MKNLEPAIIEAYATAPSNVATLESLEIKHPNFAKPVRIVRNMVDLVLTLEDTTSHNFRACAFTLSKPKQDETGVALLDLVVDDVGDEIDGLLSSIEGSADPVEVWYRVYLSDDLSQPQNNPPLRLTLSGISKGIVQINARASFADLINMQHGNQLYTRKDFPSLGE